MSDKRVVFEQDGVRVLEDGMWEFWGQNIGIWLPATPGHEPQTDALARALAESEAKRRETDAENVGLRRELKAVHRYSVGHGQ